jgi:excalibur calcium-binding domain-containing protein
MRLRSTAAAGVLFAAALSLGTGSASAADLDCSNFATQGEAQAVYNADPSDPNGLDRDKDGIACETLPGGGTTTEDDTALGSSQVSTRPVGAVAAGDGSSTEDGSALPYVLGGLALAGAGGAAVAARRSARATA